MQYAFTGPWFIRASLKGASYELELCLVASKIKMKHAADLSPYPIKLIPFQPLDGLNTHYGQLCKPIASHPFKEAGITGVTLQLRSRHLPTLPPQIIATTFIGPAYLSSMMNSLPLSGQTMSNSISTFGVTLSPHSQFSQQDCCRPRHCTSSHPFLPLIS